MTTVKIKEYGPAPARQGPQGSILSVLGMMGKLYLSVLKKQLMMTRSQFYRALADLERFDVIEIEE